LIWVDEISRCAAQSVILAFTIYTMALPPILLLGSDELVRRVVPPILRGEKFISLCISEPGAGSDVANIGTTAVEDPSGEFW
jgi:acyl-CoA dehydrogenase